MAGMHTILTGHEATGRQLPSGNLLRLRWWRLNMARSGKCNRSSATHGARTTQVAEPASPCTVNRPLNIFAISECFHSFLF